MLRFFNSVRSVDKTSIWCCREENAVREKTRFCKIRLILIVGHCIVLCTVSSGVTITTILLIMGRMWRCMHMRDGSPMGFKPLIAIRMIIGSSILIISATGLPFVIRFSIAFQPKGIFAIAGNWTYRR
jgi:hypothetical protein